MAWSKSQYKQYAQKTIKESDLQALCVRWFRTKYPKFRRLLFSIPNGANLKNGYRSWAKLKKEGAVAGAADLMLAIPSGDCPGLFIEMKTNRRGSRQTKTQKDFEADVVQIGGFGYCIARTFDEFESIIKTYFETGEY